MAYITQLKDSTGAPKRDKDGQFMWKLVFSRGRGKSPLTRPWKSSPDWSQSYLDRKSREAVAEFDADCKAGRVLDRQEKKAAQAAAEAEAARLEAEAASRPTLESYSQTWLKGKKVTCSATTVEHYETVLRLHILPVLGDFRIDTITAGQVRALLLDVVAVGKDCRLIFVVLKGIFDAAEMDDTTPGNIMRKVKKPTANKDTKKDDGPKCLTAPQLAALLDAVENRPLIQKALVYTLADSGARIGEILALQWADIDWTASTIAIRGTRDQHTGEIRATKTQESNRTVELGPDTLEALRAWQIEQAKKWGVLSDVFVGQKGQPLHLNTVGQWLHVLGEEIGVKELHPHMLRHTAATLAIENGADISGISRRLGHSSVNITLGVYTNPTDTAAARAGQLGRDAVNQARAMRKALTR